MVKFGQKIRAARQSAGLSQHQAAEIFGVTDPMVSMYENDHSRPGLDRLEKFAVRTGKSFAWFFLAADETLVQEYGSRNSERLETALQAAEKAQADLGRVIRELRTELQAIEAPASQSGDHGAARSRSPDTDEDDEDEPIAAPRGRGRSKGNAFVKHSRSSQDSKRQQDSATS